MHITGFDIETKVMKLISITLVGKVYGNRQQPFSVVDALIENPHFLKRKNALITINIPTTTTPQKR